MMSNNAGMQEHDPSGGVQVMDRTEPDRYSDSISVSISTSAQKDQVSSSQIK